MVNVFDDENGTFKVLINEEAQYSLWPDFIDIPPGWRETGPAGSRAECMKWIDDNWVDMRPASLVRQMEADAQERIRDSEK